MRRDFVIAVVNKASSKLMLSVDKHQMTQMRRYIVYVWSRVLVIFKHLFPGLGQKMSEDRELTNRRKGYEWCRKSVGGTWANIGEDQFGLGFKVVSGGLTNYLYLCSLPKKYPPQGNEPKEVLLRVYGDIAKDQEFLVRNTAVFAILSTKDLGPKLYVAHAEGRIEEYIPTQPLRTRDLQKPFLAEQIAKKMALFHAIKDMPLHKEPKFLEEKMFCWMEQVENIFSNIPTEKDEASQRMLSRLQSFNLSDELQTLLNILGSVSCPVVFSHNDLQEGNILYLEDCDQPERKMTFIDWEYCSYNYRGFDFGNHFCEWCYDYSHPDFPFFSYTKDYYPSKAQQYTFFRHYLSQQSDVEPTEEYLKGMYKEANTFALASHFFWALWSIIQRDLSEIEFGYLDYALLRVENYFDLKDRLQTIC
ncbi:choline/ethanolamine kinase-like [Mizuhopecten yessoensis]|uniref:Choline/ethanolamine kinase n=1 Tax=Mizuhopecten yessoensis TaxID=6573 RepID=A0A210Q889_MIZYE|nr:choline/ethanolamine kinase-like [Mizuhopecten yessoensis]OWF44953.1 Choline/ethanolamine kinase [Mizuhopecten yessoensis]